MTVTKVLKNASIRTMKGDNSIEQAIAFRDGSILSVGSEREVLEVAGGSAEIVDLGGRTVIPGFIDAHHHFSQAALHTTDVDCSPETAPDIATVIDRLTEAADSLPEGTWVVGAGYDELALKEKRHPTRQQIDARLPDRPVLLCHYSGHEAVVNTRALELAGIGRSTPEPQGGEIERDKSGELTGRLIETAYSPLFQQAEADMIRRDTEGFLNRIDQYQRRLFSVGITRVCDPTVNRTLERIYQQAWEQDRLCLPVLMQPISGKGHFCPPWDRLDAGTVTGEGPEHLRVGHLKVFFDGANRCAISLTPLQAARSFLQAITTAVRTRSATGLNSTADLKPYLSRDLSIHTGRLFYSREQAYSLLDRACELGFSIAIHALGNEAVDLAIDSIQAVRGRYPDGPPPQIIHVSVISREAAKRMADLGIVAVTQPHFLKLPVFETMPKPPGLIIQPVRTLLEAGVRVAGSSDAPVTDCDPLLAMESAISRTTRAGTLLHPDEAVNAQEVLAMYTREAAFALGALDVTGTLEPNKRADLVVLSKDPCHMPTSELNSVRVEQTFINGDTVYEG